ncbi:hypothetical protein [Pedococcus sp. P5_B7]
MRLPAPRAWSGALGGAFAHTLPTATWWDDLADGATLRWLR